MAEEKIDLVALQAQVEAAEAEADNALSAQDEAYANLSARLEAANERKKSKIEGLAMAKMADRLAAAKAAANGAYVLCILNADEKTEGAGKWLVRSPTSQAWKAFQDAIARAGNDAEKSDRSHRNFAASCIFYPKINVDLNMEDLVERFDRFPGLSVSICQLAADLGAAGAATRKR